MSEEAHPPISVRRYGEGTTTVVLLHGGPGAPGMMVDLAHDLAPHYRVLEPLQRRSGDIPLSVAQHVEDLSQVLDEEAILVGASWGAMLALSFASTHRGRVRSLILIGCGTYDTDSRHRLQRDMDSRIQKRDRAEWDGIQTRLRLATSEVQANREFARLGRLATTLQCLEPELRHWAADDADYRGFEETWNDVLRLQREGIEPARFGEIDVPVTMIHGTDDPHPGELIHRRLLAHIPDLTYEELEDCGHLPWLERRGRERFLETLIAHIEQVRP